MHCGFCLPTCPSYAVFEDEMDSPRGRIVLMKVGHEEGEAISPEMVTHFDRCLGCMACVTACPSGVQYDKLIEQLSPAARSRFLGKDGTSILVSASLKETPTYVTLPLIAEIEQAAKEAGGPDIIVTGVTVVTARESTRTIDDLNVSLTFAILGDLIIMILAFRNFWVGFLAVLSNTLPVLATCAILFLMDGECSSTPSSR